MTSPKEAACCLNWRLLAVHSGTPKPTGAASYVSNRQDKKSGLSTPSLRSSTFLSAALKRARKVRAAPQGRRASPKEYPRLAPAAGRAACLSGCARRGARSGSGARSWRQSGPLHLYSMTWGLTPFRRIVSSTLRDVAHFGLCQMVTVIACFFRPAPRCRPQGRSARRPRYRSGLPHPHRPPAGS
jgi:hypothetical protein